MGRLHMRSAEAIAASSLALLLALPAGAAAQGPAAHGLAVVPLLGFGVVHAGSSWNSAGAEVAIEVEYGGTSWRGSGFASERGLGVGCSEACFDGGPAVAVGAARSIGAVWLGGGAGVMRQLGRWRLLPYGALSMDRDPFRLEMRLELPQQNGAGVYLPLLVGIPIGRDRR